MSIMRIKKIPFVAYLVIIVSVISFIGYTLEDQNIISFKVYTEPDTLALFSNSEDEYLNCFLKAKTFVTDVNGNLIAVDNSPFLGGETGQHPLFSTIVRDDPQEKEVEDFQVWGKLRCHADGGVNWFSNLAIQESIVTLNVYSQDKNQNKVLTHTQSIRTIPNTILEENKESTIFIFEKINIDKILSNLEVGTYDSWHEFDIHGEVVFNYENTAVYVDGNIVDENLIISRSSIPTFIQTSFTNEVGNGGIGTTCNDNQIFDPITQTCKAKIETTGGNNSDNVTDTTDDENNTTETYECKDGSLTPVGTECPTDLEMVKKNITELGTCIVLGDVDCLQQTKFFGIYGVLSVLAIAGVMFKKKNNPVAVVQ